MIGSEGNHLIDILLVEDNPGDARLIREVFREAAVNSRISLAEDGQEALDFLRKQAPFQLAVRPELVLLDINLPKKNGLEVLSEIKADSALRRIPVVILSSSDSEQDILKGYALHANAYITKPASLDQFAQVVRSIQDFWLEIARLPGDGSLN